ncbi:4-alpha-glucanotransferase [Rhodovulum bhavnagarense]|uniref:4-alpha-glucanotransferase n=1 Tax=Rhodovulum bhavnagarense TaxID=992286 RepID=A0A4R2RAR0_9RHOB|nr:4-alpha-glucanotransferase [Rhodovulum bhavnagarense]TCP60382.1 4-alpha-glucanotransferase [Rhodovulum bhavnagarense]
MSALGALARAAGVLPVYRDLAGVAHPTGPETARALLSAMGLAAETEAEAAGTLAAWQAETSGRALPAWAVAEPGNAPDLRPVRGGEWHLQLEDGTQHEGRAGDRLALPPLPLGLHRLIFDGQETTLLAAPAALPLPPRGWGVMLPLYGLRDEARGGLGDYADLHLALAGIASQGAGFVGINPIHAGFPGDPTAISPYSPSSRRRFNVAHIACPQETALPGRVLVDHAPAIAARMACLRSEFAHLSPDDHAALAVFRRAGGAELERFAIHQALSRHFGEYWTGWPVEFHAVDGPAVGRFAVEHADEIAFHAWLQYRAETQLGAIRDVARTQGMAQGLYLDLAVGTHPAGAETWADPDLFARGVSLGAPPDPFAPQGQSWTLAPMIPHRLAARGFAPLAEILRAQLKFAGALRIDHILGFDRAFWVPKGAPGAYVAMPRAAMLAVARIEAARAGAVLVGEDLGVVPDGLQADLAGAGVLGCRLAMFDHSPGAWPEAVMASFGTHDLPPYSGWREGIDIDWHERLGHLTSDAARAARAQRLDDARDLAARTGGADVDALYRLLAASPARLVAVQIEDILGREAQANLPGTIDSHPNWRRRIGPAPGALGQCDALARTARAMQDNGR